MRTTPDGSGPSNSNCFRATFLKAEEALESPGPRHVPERPTGPAGSRHSLTGSFLLSLRSPFSCWRLETFPSNLDNFPLFLFAAFKIDQCRNAALHTALDFPCSLFKYLVGLQPRSLRLWASCSSVFPSTPVKTRDETGQAGLSGISES